MSSVSKKCPYGWNCWYLLNGQPENCSHEHTKHQICMAHSGKLCRFGKKCRYGPFKCRHHHPMPPLCRNGEACPHRQQCRFRHTRQHFQAWSSCQPCRKHGTIKDHADDELSAYDSHPDSHPDSLPFVGYYDGDKEEYVDNLFAYFESYPEYAAEPLADDSASQHIDSASQHYEAATNTTPKVESIPPWVYRQVLGISDPDQNCGNEKHVKDMYEYMKEPLGIAHSKAYRDIDSSSIFQSRDKTLLDSISLTGPCCSDDADQIGDLAARLSNMAL